MVSMNIFNMNICGTVETALYDHPLVQHKTVLKGRWFVKKGWLRHAHAMSTLSTHLQLYTLISYIFTVQSLQKGCFKLTQAYNKVHVYSPLVPYADIYIYM